ncbi:MAG: hypothetical protein WBF09_03960 [Candidatus Acidiferrum sp.]
MNEIIAMLQKAQKEQFWGQLEFTFHNGEVTVVRRVETFKINSGNGQGENRHEYRSNR